MSNVSVVQWLVDTSIDVSVLVILVLAFRGTVVRLFGVSFGYLLWLVPAARLAFSILPIQVQGAMSALILPEFFHAPAGTIPSAATEPGSATTSIMVGIWLTGFLAAVVHGWLSQVRSSRQILGLSQPLEPEYRRKVDDYCQRMGVFPAVEALYSPAVSAPLLLGLVSPRLVLPSFFFQTADEPELVIRHELVHFKRRDIAINLTVRLVRCVFWFNPLMYWAESRIRADQEVSCDYEVLDGESARKRRAYGLAMLSAAGPRTSPGVLGAGFVDTRTVMKERTLCVIRHRVHWARSLTGAVVLAVAVLMGVGYGVEAPARDIDWTSALTFPGPLPGGCSS